MLKKKIFLSAPRNIQELEEKGEGWRSKNDFCQYHLWKSLIWFSPYSGHNCLSLFAAFLDSSFFISPPVLSKLDGPAVWFPVISSI